MNVLRPPAELKLSPVPEKPPPSKLVMLTVEEDGTVHGRANPGRQNAPIRRGHFDARTGAVTLEGDAVNQDGSSAPFRIDGRLDGRTVLGVPAARDAGKP